MQPGDVKATWENVDCLIKDLDYKLGTHIKDGISKFVEWYKEYYRI